MSSRSRTRSPARAAKVEFYGARELHQLSQKTRSKRLDLAFDGTLAGHGFDVGERHYGRLTKESESFLPQACPIVASYGGRDRRPGVRETFDRLVPALEAAGIDHDAKLYPNAGHGFLNDHHPAELSLWVKALAKLTAAEPHEPSAQDARRRIVDFFDAHLKP